MPNTIGELHPSEKNPRKISDEKLGQLKKTMGHFGDLSGVVFNRRLGRLVTGHQRTKNLPVDSKIVIETEYDERLSDGTVSIGYILDAVTGQHWAYRETEWDELDDLAANLCANQSGGEFDTPRLAEVILHLDEANYDLDDTGFSSVELENVVAPVDKSVDGKCEDDEVPEPPKVPKSKRGDLYLLGDHRLLCGDATSDEDFKRLSSELDKIALCFTSPPYSDQRDYSGGLKLDTEHVASFIPIASNKTVLFAVNLGIQRKESEIFTYWDSYRDSAKNAGLKLLSWNVWDKGECGSIGNQTAMFGISHEWIFVFGKERVQLNLTVPNKFANEMADHSSVRLKDGSLKERPDRRVSEFSQLKTVYRVSAQKARDEINHPARFSVEFPIGYIEACTNPREWVYEPFCGSGTTIISCEKTNRNCLAMELSPEYTDVILTRFIKFTGKPVLLQNPDGTTTDVTADFAPSLTPQEPVQEPL